MATLAQAKETESKREYGFLLLLPFLIGLGIFLIAMFQFFLTESLASGYGCGGVLFGFSGCIDFNGQPPWQAWETAWEGFMVIGSSAMIGNLEIKRFHYSRQDLEILGLSTILLFLIAIMSASNI